MTMEWILCPLLDANRKINFDRHKCDKETLKNCVLFNSHNNITPPVTKCKRLPFDYEKTALLKQIHIVCNIYRLVAW